MTTPLVSIFGEFCPYFPSSLLIRWMAFPRTSSTVAFTVAPTYSSDTMFLSERAANTELDRTRTRTWTRTDGTGGRVHLGDVMSSFRSSLHPNCQEAEIKSFRPEPEPQHPDLLRTAGSNCLLCLRPNMV